MKKTQPDFEVLSRIAGIMGLYLSKTNQSKKGEVAGPAYVAVDGDRDAVAVCATLKDLSLEMAWRVRWFARDVDHARFAHAVEAGSITWGELVGVAGEAHPGWTEKAEQQRLGQVLPSAQPARPGVRI
jgi:hypothetical protein